MPYRYAISDPHGCLDILERALSAVDLSGGNHLFLLGDYVPHTERSRDEAGHMARCEESLLYLRAYCRKHGGSVTALMGNHEFELLDAVRYRGLEIDVRAMRFLRGLKLYAETAEQVFVHAGVDEDAGDYWRVATPDIMFVAKFEFVRGYFEKDIIAGHRSAARLAGGGEFRGVFWDGQSHYVIDGATEDTGVIPVLRYDTESGVYMQLLATATGVSDAMPIEPAS